MKKNKEFLAGIKNGLAIGIGYFSVSFGFGSMAVVQGLNVWHAVLISATNMTSAGQFAGLTVIATGATLLEMMLTQLVINSRYALMGLALSQRLGESVGFGKRLIAAFFNTDEIFALGMARHGTLTTSFFVGVGVSAFLGWTGGTALGALAGSLLPLSVRTALSVLLYGMFVAVVVPQVKREKPLLFVMVLALVLSSLFEFVPFLNGVSAGLAIVISTVVSAAVCALLFPMDKEAAS